MADVLAFGGYRDAAGTVEPNEADASDVRLFASLAPKILANGYSAIPVSPGAKHVPRSEPDWRRFCWQKMTPSELKTYQRRYADHGVGLACGFHTVAIDIDAEDEFLSLDLLSGAEEIFSKTPLIRAGKTPHFALVYACSEPIVTYMLPWLEILGVGRYVVAYGDHVSTGKRYRWICGHAPIDTPVWDLPRVTQASVDRYVKAVSPMLGVDHREIGFDIGQEHMEWMLSSRTQLASQLAFALFRGKPSAKVRARKLLADGVFCVPTLKVRAARSRSCRVDVRRRRVAWRREPRLAPLQLMRRCDARLCERFALRLAGLRSSRFTAASVASRTELILNCRSRAPAKTRCAARRRLASS
jgi:Bifunctional DNA primase/polymerase, N-terminal